jgi:hypothetical protein
MTHEGYAEWRHPGIAFAAAGCSLLSENREKCCRIFENLYQRPLPSEPSLLCPQCHARAEEELPDLLKRDAALEESRRHARLQAERTRRGQYLGVQRPWD